jgi:hypothetical protein
VLTPFNHRRTPGSDPVNLSGEIARDRAIVVAVGTVGLDIQRKTYYDKELDFRISACMVLAAMTLRMNEGPRLSDRHVRGPRPATWRHSSVLAEAQSEFIDHHIASQSMKRKGLSSHHRRDARSISRVVIRIRDRDFERAAALGCCFTRCRQFVRFTRRDWCRPFAQSVCCPN